MERILIALFTLAIPLHPYAQHLQIHQSAPMSMGANELETPFSAGSDFAPQVLMQGTLSVSLMEVPEVQQWCLCVAFFETFPNGEGVAIYPNSLAPIPLTPGTNAPKKPVLVTSLYQAVLSGTGPLQDVPMDVYLTNFKVQHAKGTRQWPLTWQLRDGPCIFF